MYTFAFVWSVSVQVNADYKIKPWLTVSSNTSIEKWSTQSISQHSDNGSVLLAAITSSPLEAPRGRYEDLPGDMQQAIDKGITNAIDSCSLMRSFDKKLSVVVGPNYNIKITTPEDFYVFRALYDALENEQLM